MDNQNIQDYPFVQLYYYNIFSSNLSLLQTVIEFCTTISDKDIHSGVVVPIVCVVLVGLFALQHHGTHKVSFMFAPIVIIWLFSIAALGMYNIVKWNPEVYRALSPYYLYKFLKQTKLVGWRAIEGLLLCITGEIFLMLSVPF